MFLLRLPPAESRNNHSAARLCVKRQTDVMEGGNERAACKPVHVWERPRKVSVPVFVGRVWKPEADTRKKTHQIRRIKQPRFLISRVWLKCVCESKVTSCSLIGETSFLLLKWRNIRCCLQKCTFKQARFIKKKRCHCGAETWLTRKVPSVQCAQPIRAKQMVNTWGHKVWYVGWLTETAALSVLQV